MQKSEVIWGEGSLLFKASHKKVKLIRKLPVMIHIINLLDNKFLNMSINYGG